ncbi:hypothetical protein ACA910_012616 [Epithemia clementina (nom. ined.)]
MTFFSSQSSVARRQEEGLIRTLSFLREATMQIDSDVHCQTATTGNGKRVRNGDNGNNIQRGDHGGEEFLEDVSSQSLMQSLIDPDFEELASHFPEFRLAYRRVLQEQQGRPFAACITQELSIALTKALLHTTFGISLTNIPVHHLCPPVPNRFFMVQWLQDKLLPCIHQRSNEYFASSRQRLYTGLDVGTGATCIYPLLFMASVRKNHIFEGQCPPWKLWASDVDEEAIDLANANVLGNQLRQFIQPILVPQTTRQANPSVGQSSSSLFEGDSMIHGPLNQSLSTMMSMVQTTENREESLCLDFCITNPPFYENDEERIQIRQGDGRARTSMTVNEGTYPGGEVGFVCDILLDQCHLVLHRSTQLNNPSAPQHAGGDRCITTTPPPPPGWTVVMCGKKTSFVSLYNIVTQMLGYTHVCTSEFGPGQLTRWFLAWTWQECPCPKSPLALTETWEFSVDNKNIGDGDESSDVEQEMIQRLSQFAQEFGMECAERTVVLLDSKRSNRSTSRPRSNYGRGQSNATRLMELWKHSDSESNDCVAQWVQEDENHLPEDLVGILRQLPTNVRRNLLPAQGHFLLTVEVRTISVRETVLHVKAFIYTSHGKRHVARLKQQMPGEISRTNRKWRRRLKQEEKEPNKPQETNRVV